MVAISAIFVLCLSSNAQAFGIGGYFEYGNVDGEIELLVGDDVDFDADQYGVGVVFDSNLARDSLFNYRGTFGYRRSEHTFETFLGDVEVDAEGFEMNHLFGFGVVRTKHMRVFIGPASRFGFDDFDAGSGVDLVNIDLGVGPEIGMNVHLSRHLTVSPWIAYQFHYLVQVVDVNGVGDDVGDGYEHVVKAGISILFRSGSDQYSASRSRRKESGRTD
jgi:hypothetical protein